MGDGDAGDPDRDAFDRAAAELLIVPPSGFTRARNERAAAESGDLGRRIRALRKPTVAAWAVNLLSHDHAFRDALELSGALREAQEDFDAIELARLGHRRRALVSALAGRAAVLVEQAGVALAAGARDEVERTVNAAIVDPAAGAVVAAGRLVRPLDPGALTPDDLMELVAGSLPGAPDDVVAARDDLAERRARREAGRRRREAEKAAAEARRVLGRREAEISSARERADRLHERAEELRRDLARVADEAETAAAAVAALERGVGEARDAVSAAERRVRADDAPDQ
ncbi:transposase [Microbacterium oleivorans]|uniref:Transposase n=1 Tax=Microbacterium oleivorans TaxID=273677 RepID=A0A7D5JFR6_9MICO|nr:transposase [Microbacterium oleivorans]QLD12118.1 transposase [Microbacterium oleivorans]